MSELLRPSLKCFCVGERNQCPNRGERRNTTCRCPCHFTQEELQNMAASIVRLVPNVSGFLARQVAKSGTAAKRLGGIPIAYSCGHEMVPESSLSRMAIAYIQTHRCDNCAADAPFAIYLEEFP